MTPSRSAATLAGVLGFEVELYALLLGIFLGWWAGSLWPMGSPSRSSWWWTGHWTSWAGWGVTARTESHCKRWVTLDSLCFGFNGWISRGRRGIEGDNSLGWLWWRPQAHNSWTIFETSHIPSIFYTFPWFIVGIESFCSECTPISPKSTNSYLSWWRWRSTSLPAPPSAQSPTTSSPSLPLLF